MAYRVDTWYRSAGDSDRSVQQTPQMCSGAETSGDIVRMVRELQAQGYEVQRVQVESVCPTCKGNARICVRKFKRAPTKYKDCLTCKGQGTVGGRLDWPVETMRDEGSE